LRLLPFSAVDSERSSMRSEATKGRLA
jgi:hypothetical protein